MAAGWSVLDALNKNSKAAVDDKPTARFRTRDISIRKMYSNEKNFYSMTDIEKLAQDILTCGLLENMTVTYAPCEKGEYRIIAGERRWRALTMLCNLGYKEFEVATCQIKNPAEEHEETVQLIMANAYRDKTVMDVLEEEKQLKAALQYMKDNGLTLQGYKLDSGRLRDVIASIMNMTGTKIAQIESINNRLIPEFTQELKEGRLTFSAAYEISGMDEDRQRDMLERYKETGSLTWKDVKEAKAAAAAAEEQEEIPGQMNYPEDFEEEDDADQQEADRFAHDQDPTDEEIFAAWQDVTGRGTRLKITEQTTKDGLIEQLKEYFGRSYNGFSANTDPVTFIKCSPNGIKLEVKIEGRFVQRKMISWTAFVNKVIEAGLFTPMKEVDAHPEAKESICYACDNYEACLKKQTNVMKCDSFVDRREARKTDEERYSEEQDRIDRETKKKLEAMQEDQQGQREQDDRPQRYIRVSADMYHAIETQQIPYMIVLKDAQGYREGDRLMIIAMKDGKATGDRMKAVVTCVDDDTTSGGICEGYAVIGVMDIYDAESLGLIDLEDED